MACRDKYTLQSGTINGGTAGTGSAGAVALKEGDNLIVGEITSGAVTGTTSLVMKIQGSFDNSHWSDLLAFTAITSSTQYEVKYTASADYLKPLPPYVRASWADPGAASSIAGVVVNLFVGRA